MHDKDNAHENVDQWVDQWMDHLERQGRSPLTCAAYLRALVHFAHWVEETYGDKLEPQAVIPRDVRDWKTYQQTIEKSSPSTINQRLVALGGFFSWAVSQGHSSQRSH